VHGNLEALEAVAADFKSHGVTRSFFIGDAVGYGPSPNECLKTIAELTPVRLLGNHDHAVLRESGTEEFNKHARTAIDWTKTELSSEARDVLQSFTMNEHLEHIHLVHATPFKPQSWDYILDQRSAAVALGNFTEKICFIGHTHQPRIFRETDGSPCREIPIGNLILEERARYVINVGSVGQPRDGDPRACYVLFDPDSWHLEYRRVPYDIGRTQNKMRAAALPEFLVSRLETGH